MNIYNIKIDGLYFVNMSDNSVSKAPTGGWYDTGKSVKGVLLTTEKELAKKIDGNVNLKSYFNKIYDAIRYGGLEFTKIEFEKVGEE